MDKQKLESLCISDIEFKTLLSDDFKNRKSWTKPNEKDIVSHIPGNILKIFVKEGQKIKAGAKLLILEAMKMENVVTSHLNGTIKTIFIKEGDRTPKGTILIELE